jgi:hypothetical protein
MTEEINNCLQCSRKIMPSISNRCMYCGTQLPEAHHLSQEEKARVLSNKMQQFKENEDNAEHIISNIRRDFALPEKRISRKKRQELNAEKTAAATAAIASTTIKGGGGEGNSSQ